MVTLICNVQWTPHPPQGGAVAAVNEALITISGTVTALANRADVSRTVGFSTGRCSSSNKER